MSNSNNRKVRSARATKIVVRVCRFRVYQQIFGACLFGFVVGIIGIWAIIAGRLLVGALLLSFSVFPAALTAWWLRNIGKIVLTLRSDGLTSYDEFMPWSDIVNVEFKRPARSSGYIIVMLGGGKTINVFDDYLDRPIHDVFVEITKRVGLMNQNHTCRTCG